MMSFWKYEQAKHLLSEYNGEGSRTFAQRKQSKIRSYIQKLLHRRYCCTSLVYIMLYILSSAGVNVVFCYFLSLWPWHRPLSALNRIDILIFGDFRDLWLRRPHNAVPTPRRLSGRRVPTIPAIHTHTHTPSVGISTALICFMTSTLPRLLVYFDFRCKAASDPKRCGAASKVKSGTHSNGNVLGSNSLCVDPRIKANRAWSLFGLLIFADLSAAFIWKWAEFCSKRQLWWFRQVSCGSVWIRARTFVARDPLPPTIPSTSCLPSQ